MHRLPCASCGYFHIGPASARSRTYQVVTHVAEDEGPPEIAVYSQNRHRSGNERSGNRLDALREVHG